MLFKPPPWTPLITKLQSLGVRDARANFSQLIHHTVQERARLIVTDNGKATIGIAPARDIAVLELLDRHPDLKAHLEERMASEFPANKPEEPAPQ